MLEVSDIFLLGDIFCCYFGGYSQHNYDYVVYRVMQFSPVILVHILFFSMTITNDSYCIVAAVWHAIIQVALSVILD